MAKGARASTRKRNNALKAAKQRPVIAEQDKLRSIRLTAYMALQKVKKLESEAKRTKTELVIDEETRIAAQHGKELAHCDDQKRALREKGHHFFVHPSMKSAEEAFPVVNEPNGTIPIYTHEMDAKDKNIKFSKLDLIEINLARQKNKRGRQRNKHAKF